MPDRKDRFISVREVIDLKVKEMEMLSNPIVDGFTYHFLFEDETRLEGFSKALGSLGFGFSYSNRVDNARYALGMHTNGDSDEESMEKKYKDILRECKRIGGVVFVGATPAISGRDRKG